MAYQFPYNDLFIVDDDYSTSNNNSYGAYANSASLYWSQIVSLISTIREADVLDGETAQFIEEHALQLQTTFQDRLTQIIRGEGGLESTLNQYIQDIDDADDCLY